MTKDAVVSPGRTPASGAAWVAVAVAALALVGCSSVSSDGDAASQPSSPTSSSSSNANVGCDLARPTEAGAPAPGADDVVIGPLAYEGAARSYQGRGNPFPAPQADADGITYFKTGARLPPDTTVTVSIGRSARSYAGIVTEHGPRAGYPRVRYQACSSRTHPGPMWWVSGFALTGRESACVPLDVQVEGETRVRHTVVSLETGPCDT